MRRFLSLLLVAGCTATMPALPDPERAGFTAMPIRQPDFTLASYIRIRQTGAPLRIYIEGDGLAWITRTMPSGDPTPLEATGLRLAMRDDTDNVAYLGRPCQYFRAESPACSPDYWTGKRFSMEVVMAMNDAIDALLASTGTQGVELIGYSGGGAVAVLIASIRRDVMGIVTIAGNLDTEAVNRMHHVSPMPDSLNPVDQANAVSSIPQRHYTGLKDAIVPPAIADRFAAALGRGCAGLVTRVADASHDRGWVERWPDMYTPPQTCASLAR
jgi:pimeloyl-ACP methyl ester carboxylesterase